MEQSFKEIPKKFESPQIISVSNIFSSEYISLNQKTNTYQFLRNANELFQIWPGVKVGVDQMFWSTDFYPLCNPVV